METIKGLFKFAVDVILIHIAVIVIGLAAPVLFTVVPFVVIAKNPGADLSMFSTAYLMAGPFVSAFWMIIMCHLPLAMKAYRVGKLDEYKAEKGGVRGVLKAIGFMVLGFIGTVIAEGVLLVVTNSVHTQAEYVRFFMVAPFAVFAPVLILLAVRYLRSKREDAFDDQIEAARFARQYEIDVKRHAEKQATAAKEAQWLSEIGIRA